MGCHRTELVHQDVRELQEHLCHWPSRHFNMRPVGSCGTHFRQEARVVGDGAVAPSSCQTLDSVGGVASDPPCPPAPVLLEATWGPCPRAVNGIEGIARGRWSLARMAGVDGDGDGSDRWAKSEGSLLKRRYLFNSCWGSSD